MMKIVKSFQKIKSLLFENKSSSLKLNLDNVNSMSQYPLLKLQISKS